MNFLQNTHVIPDAFFYANNIETSEDCKETREVRDMLKEISRSPPELDKSNYKRLLRFTLSAEECQQRKDLRKAIMKDVTATSSGKNKIKIITSSKDTLPKINETLELSEKGNKKKILAIVSGISDNEIELTKAGSEEVENRKFNIRIHFQEYPFKCRHAVLNILDKKRIFNTIFPGPTEQLKSNQMEIQWIERKIGNNPEQAKCVENILRKSSYPAPFLLHGPPRSGKTQVIIEAVCQIYKLTNSQVLICAPSNAATDVITERLLNKVKNKDMLRIYSTTRPLTKISSKLHACANIEGGKVNKITEDDLTGKKIILCTLITATGLITLEHQETSFSYIILDEIGTGLECDTLIPITIANKKGNPNTLVVLSGDHLQLAPTVKCREIQPILGTSMMERLSRNELYKKDDSGNFNQDYVIRLVRNFRNHPAILQPSSEMFYENDLIATNKILPEWLRKLKWININFPIIFSDMKGKETKSKLSTSSSCDEEITIVLKYLEMLKASNNKAHKFGIITPFQGQRERTTNQLKEKDLASITTGTAELFQGSEREVIIISAVRQKLFKHNDKKHIGFLSDPK